MLHEIGNKNDLAVLIAFAFTEEKLSKFPTEGDNNSGNMKKNYLDGISKLRFSTVAVMYRPK